MKKFTFSECLSILRRHQERVPIETIPLAHDLGLSVYKVMDWEDNIAGKIEKNDDLGGESGYAIFVNGNHTEQRRRFTIAHEISHFILHAHMIGDGIFDDALYRSNKSHYIEVEANQMAADILMPIPLIMKMIDAGIDSPADLAKKFNVSEKAMEIRMRLIKPGLNAIKEGI